MKWRAVLSLDWDAFTGSCEGTYADCGACGWKSCQWTRGSDTPLRGNAAHACQSGVFEAHISGMLDHVAHYALGRPLLVAECHASVYRHISHKAHVVNIDAHTDCVDCEDTPDDIGRLACGSWGSWARLRKACTLEEYERSIPQPLVGRARYAFVFLCKSSPWTPAAFDAEFNGFIWALTAATKPLRFIGHRAARLRRSYERYLFRQKGERRG